MVFTKDQQKQLVQDAFRDSFESYIVYGEFEKALKLIKTEYIYSNKYIMFRTIAKRLNVMLAQNLVCENDIDFLENIEKFYDIFIEKYGK